MKEGDSVEDFHEKMNILMDCAKSALKTQVGAKYNNVMMQPMKTSMIKTFVDDLSPEIGNLVDIK